jgi:hypothetical protein
MRKAPLLLILLLIPTQLMALSTKDVLALVAMPLAVAAVGDAAGVPQDQLADVVATLNQANVPPVQFVEVVRYVPVMVTQPAQPTFVEFIRTETSNGITGPALVTSITRRLQTTYNVTPQLTFDQPATTFVVSNDYIPQTTFASSNPLALIALPLAVAAVADITGMPQNQLADFVASLNSANMPVTQEIQVIRYVPVALVADNGPQFVEFVQTQVTQGVTGQALVPVVVERLQTFYPQPQQIVVSAPAQRVVFDDDFVRPVHPHGGPPGQIKKQLGLQTGAEVVHGRKPGRPVTLQPMISSGPAPKAHGRGHGKGHKENVQFVAPPVVQQPVVVQQQPPAVVQQRGNENRGHGGDKGGDKGDHGKGGGKGKGKDH